MLPSVGTYCNRTWDGWLCWEDSVPGTVLQMCPTYFHDFDPAGETLTCVDMQTKLLVFALTCTLIVFILNLVACPLYKHTQYFNFVSVKQTTTYNNFFIIVKRIRINKA